MKAEDLLQRSYWIDELKVYQNAITNRISALTNAINKLKETRDKDDHIIEHLISWRTRLSAIAVDLNRVIEKFEEGGYITASISACDLKDRIYAITIKTNPKDPVYANIKNLIVGTLALLDSICKSSG